MTPATINIMAPPATLESSRFLASRNNKNPAPKMIIPKIRNGISSYNSGCIVGENQRMCKRVVPAPVLRFHGIGESLSKPGSNRNLKIKKPSNTTETTFRITSNLLLRRLVGDGGFEPPASTMSMWRSNR